MSIIGKIRMVGAMLSLVVVWILVIVVLAQKNRIADMQLEVSKLRSEFSKIEAVPHGDNTEQSSIIQGVVSEMKADYRNFEERLDNLSAAIASTPDYAADIENLGEEVSELKEEVNGFNKALRGLQLMINARSKSDL